MRKLIVGILLVFGFMSAYAQEFGLPPLTNYQHNWMILNPAFAGTREVGSANAFALTKPGAEKSPGPLYSQFSFHTPTKNEKVALGFTYYNKQTPVRGIGNWDPYLSEHSVFATYAYRVKVQSGRLALGLSAGFSYQGLSVASLDLLHSQDPSFIPVDGGDVVSKALPNIGTGVLYYNEEFHVGLSIPRILSLKDEENDSFFDFRKLAPIATGGYEYKFSENLTLNPCAMLQFNPGDPLGYGIGLNAAFLDERFWLGSVYKTGNNLSFNFNLKLTPQWLVGMAYDYTLGDTPNYFNGSYEIVIRYELVKTSRTNIPFYY